MSAPVLEKPGSTPPRLNADVLAEFADVEGELARAGITVPPASPTDTITVRFLTLLAHADAYDAACRSRIAD